MKNVKRSRKVLLNALMLLLLFAGNAYASRTSTNPIDRVLAQVADSLSGPIAISVALIGLFLGSMYLILGDPGKGARFIISVLVGTAIISAGVGFLGLFTPLGAVM